MINKIIILLLALYTSDGICGVSVLGTRFLINDNMQHLNIKLVNDYESDYLIKSNVDDKDFIISPPLFLLPKNSSNIITVIPKNKKRYSEDKIINLTITAIPKSASNNDTNAISLAVRNHFKMIYRHAELKHSDFDQLSIIQEDNKCIINNDSNFVFTISLSKKPEDPNIKLINIAPHEKKSVENAHLSPNCEGWVNFHNEDNDIIKTIKVTK
ncbi:molecular chaperone [Klebsiella sp. BIGb0407]|uniref:fimbrial biogenesis chaperone n=1 Tax=Klebsiella sp. BIGb0407 TaxID=2940603 RepID=UPI00216718CA|nr:fimbria/pilus periplasmic chaperone [Klebsiella sp. BIGb0407]MCS3433419.1 P pilus assembly chaperone PapD [Klebsiella sp. BIGb0407]